MRAAIHQPCYMPWLGMLKKASMCDVFVFMDDAQYTRGSFIESNSIKTPQGAMRLRVPLDYDFGDTISQVRPKYGLKWREKHLKALRMNYGKAPHFDDVYQLVTDILSPEYLSLADLNIACTEAMFKWFGISPRTERAGRFGIETAKERRVIDLCKAVGADVYVSGKGAATYQDAAHFADEGIELVYADYEPKPYRQRFGEFVPNLSAIDWMMNEGHGTGFLS